MTSSLQISINPKFQNEKLYVLKVLFREILGIDYEIMVSTEVSSTIIKFGNKYIQINDTWRDYADEENSFFSISSLPNPIMGLNKYTSESDIPIIYGNNEIIESEESIYCGIDIIASSFFMLARWEERVNASRDKHGRFSGIDSIAYKFGFLHRPVVNEYAEMLLSMLRRIGFVDKPKYQGYHLNITHDIDYLTQTTSISAAIKSMGINLLRKRDIKNALVSLTKPFKDEFDTFDVLMSISEQINAKSHFYFMAENPSIDKVDSIGYLQNPNFLKTVSEIKRRGHIIGFHASYSTLNDSNRFSSELHRLENMLGENLVEGRQHYLRVSIPDTLRIWSENKLRIDSSLGYHDVDGFRCGTGCAFTFYDYINREELNVKECPLIVMDCTLRGYQNLSDKDVFDALIGYMQIGKKYNMPITFLYHNSFFIDQNKPLLKIYKEAILYSNK